MTPTIPMPGCREAGRVVGAGRCGSIGMMKALVPWLVVLAVVIALNALRLRPVATAVVLGWLVYCVWTWVRPRDRGR